MKKLLFILALLSLAWSAGAQRGTATVSGYITDAESGETLLGAGVLVSNGAKTPTGAVTNVYGYYTLTIPRGTTTLQYSYVGYTSETVQLNVLADGSVELVPRVGKHIAYLGQPKGITKKLERLRKFYLYGLNVAGWNKYSRVSVEYGNQIVCKRR